VLNWLASLDSLDLLMTILGIDPGIARLRWRVVEEAKTLYALIS